MADQPETGNPQGETPTETPEVQEQNTETVLTPEQRLAKVEAALKKANHEAASYRKKAEAFEKAEQDKRQAEMTELDKAKARSDQLEREVAALRLDALRTQAAKDIGLPLEFADRLKGETLEELKADAEAVAALLPKTPPKTPPQVPPTNPGNASKGETDDQRRARIYGTGVNIFDPKFAEEHGGGVHFVNKE